MEVMVPTLTGFRVEIKKDKYLNAESVADQQTTLVEEPYVFNRHEQQVADFYDFVKANKQYLFPTLLILGTGFAIGAATAASLTAAGIPRMQMSQHITIPPVSEIAGFLNISEHEAVTAMMYLDPYQKSDAFRGENSGRILLDILVIGCFGGIISAVLAASGQKNIAILIGFVATMIIILKVVDLVNKVIDGIAKFLGM